MRKAPTKGERLTRETFALVAQSGRSMASIEREAGLGQGTMDNWRRKRSPTTVNLEAALNCMGYTLRIVPMKERAP